MNSIISLVIFWLVTAVALYLVSLLPFGVEIDSFPKALISAIVFGLVNGIIGIVAFPFNFITFGLFSWFFNIIAFGIAAWLVQGFRLRMGILSAILGAFSLAIVSSIINHVINTFIFPVAS